MCLRALFFYFRSLPPPLFLVLYFSHSTSSAWARASTSLLSWQFFVIVEVVDVWVSVHVRLAYCRCRLEHAALIKLYNLINIDTCQFLPNEISFGSLFFESLFSLLLLLVFWLFCRAAGWLLYSWTFTKRYCTTKTMTKKQNLCDTATSTSAAPQYTSIGIWHTHYTHTAKWIAAKEIQTERDAIQYSMANARITENYFLILSNKPSVFSSVLALCSMP